MKISLKIVSVTILFVSVTIAILVSIIKSPTNGDTPPKNTDISFYDNNSTLFENSKEEESELGIVPASINQDGVYDLGSFGSWRCLDAVFYESDYDATSAINLKKENKKYFVYSSIDHKIGSFNKNSTTAIYSDFQEINLIKITDNKSYTYDINFTITSGYNCSKYQVTECVEPISGGYPLFNFLDSDEIEINNEDYEKYVKKNSFCFVNYQFSLIYDGYMILKSQKGDRIEVGGYHGINWDTYEFQADTQYYIVNDKDKVTIPTQKTRNGYFTVDLSNLENGLYYYKELDAIINIE
ncbi:MAG: hypothetical protein MJ168_01225 [Clostridia bacterium]|nr:hypothetical protein [Clostridia bacterium]